jgi:hypothetical protein
VRDDVVAFGSFTEAMALLASFADIDNQLAAQKKTLPIFPGPSVNGTTSPLALKLLTQQLDSPCEGVSGPGAFPVGVSKKWGRSRSASPPTSTRPPNSLFS